MEQRQQVWIAEYIGRHLTWEDVLNRMRPPAVGDQPNIESPAKAALAPGPHDYIQPELGHALRVWWAYYWPTTIITFVAGILITFAVRRLYEGFVFSAKTLLPFQRYGAYVVNAIAALFVMRHVLGKTFRHFRIRLVSTQDPAAPEFVKATFARALRVWWAFLWRIVIYTVLAMALVLYPMGMFVGIFGPSPLVAATIIGLLGFVVGAALSLFVIYSNILDEDIGDFRVVLLPREQPVGASQPLATNPAPLG
jgi:hypothetical protein